MAEARDREQLGDALQQADDDRLDVAQHRGRLSDGDPSSASADDRSHGADGRVDRWVARRSHHVEIVSFGESRSESPATETRGGRTSPAHLTHRTRRPW